MPAAAETAHHGAEAAAHVAAATATATITWSIPCTTGRFGAGERRGDPTGNRDDRGVALVETVGAHGPPPVTALHRRSIDVAVGRRCSPTVGCVVIARSRPRQS